MWVYFAAFMVAFFQCIYLAIYVLILRSISRGESSMLSTAFRQSLLPASVLIVFLIICASTTFPVTPSPAQITAFVVLCLSEVLMVGWWQLGSQQIGQAQRKRHKSDRLP
jgi:hypothetical protein